MSKKAQNPEHYHFMRVIEQIQLRDQSLYRSIKQLVINLRVQSMLQTCFHSLNLEISIQE